MTYNPKVLCLSLMQADTEDEVVRLLSEHGLWQDQTCWRLYGDEENNYGSAGNQADEAEASLVEKITNSRDAILMNECMIRGIDPVGIDAPESVTKAVAMFFEDDPKNELAGQVREWDDDKRRRVAKQIAVVVSGSGPSKQYPSVAVIDKGEGQTPLQIPETILSIGKSIKQKIRFVHGKWNMGGTAALVFAGKLNLQLVVSRRNPKLLEDKPTNPRDDEWGFTIVRRENPTGPITTSTFKYLAPIANSERPDRPGILSFKSQTLTIFPEYNKPNTVPSEWGTYIKLYEYQTSYKQKVQGNGGILRPLDLLAAELGVPFRLHECRYPQEKPGSTAHQVNGIRVRLADNKGDALEAIDELNKYPTDHTEVIDGEIFHFIVYAFKPGKATSYRDAGKGVVFTLNGQSQGWLDDQFYNRNKVGLGTLRTSLLTIVDCSELTYRKQEELFINDRVHLRKTPFRDRVEERLMYHLKHHQGLAKLQEERKRQLINEKVGNAKPIEDVLRSVMKHSSTLSRIFLQGQRLSNPLNTEQRKAAKIPFAGAQFPKYFKFKKKDYGHILHRDAHHGSDCRISFETDAENFYFGRKTQPGRYNLYALNAETSEKIRQVPGPDHGFNLYNGIATLNLKFADSVKVGDVLKFVLEVTDPMRIVDPPFINEFHITIKQAQPDTKGKSGKRIDPPGTSTGGNRETSTGLDIPVPNPVYKAQWLDLDMDKFSAIHARKSVKTGSDGKEVVTFELHVNMDNIYLQTEIKHDIQNKELLISHFTSGLALQCISMIYEEDRTAKQGQEKYEGIEDRIAETTRAMALVILPMIKELGDRERELRSNQDEDSAFESVE